MYNLRIEVGKKVYYNVELGDSYLKVSNVEECDPELKLGSNFHDVINSIYKACEFVPSVAIFKNGKTSLSNFVDFSDLQDFLEIPNNFRCWIMNSTGDTIETFTVVQLKNPYDEDDYKAITLEDQYEETEEFFKT